MTFSEPVNGVTASNFVRAISNTGGTAPTVTSATPTGGAPATAWTVSMSTSGTTGLNNGSIGLNLANTTNIKDVATNNLSATTPVVGQAYTYDTTAPTATITLQAASDSGTSNSDNITNANTLIFNVNFSEPVTGLAAGDFSNQGTATGCTFAAPSGSGVAYTVSVTGCSEGTVIVRLATNAVSDAAGNGNGQTDGATVTIDRTAPTVTITSRPPRTRAPRAATTSPMRRGSSSTSTSASPSRAWRRPTSRIRERRRVVASARRSAAPSYTVSVTRLLGGHRDRAAGSAPA